MDAFLTVHRRTLRPEPLQMPETVAQLIAEAPVADEAATATGSDEVAADGGAEGSAAQQPKLV